MTSAGQLRERVRFQQRTLDANDDRLGPWDPDGLPVRARVQALKGSEPVLQQRLLGLQPVAVTIRRSRASAAIDTGWRMLWNGQPYNLKTVVPDESRVWIEILAEADQTQGG